MPSDKQLAANRANATRSTGPRTPEGKARSAQNAAKHGLARKHSFTGDTFAIVTIEDRAAIDRLRADLIAVYQPANSQELFAVERIALAQHNLLRLARLESGLATTALNKILTKRDEKSPSVPLHEELSSDSDEIQAQNYFLAHGFHRMNVENSATWALFLRYQSQVERHYRRAIEDLDRLRALRSKLPNEPISEASGPRDNGSDAPQHSEVALAQ